MSSQKDLAILKAITQTCQFDERYKINNIPPLAQLDPKVDHAPKRKHTLTKQGIQLAINNALSKLAVTFEEELQKYGHIYMFNYMPKEPLTAIPYELCPGKIKEAKCMIHMILNNLDPNVAQFPQELITYGGNGAVFQNWAQFHLTVKFLTEMNNNQCLSMYSGHPHGLFPKLSENSPSAVISNGIMVPNYSTPDIFDNLYAQGVTMYGQMTAGSWMYIGPQGIVHGTTLTVAQAAKIQNPKNPNIEGKIFVTSGLGGMSGAQPKAMQINGGVCIVAEINPKPLSKRHSQGWLMEKSSDLNEVIEKAKQAKQKKQALSIGYLGNVVDLWEKLAESDLEIHLGSDQTSLHNPFNGGYYPVGLSFEESQKLMTENPAKFKKLVHESLRRQINAINKVNQKCGMYFFDYGNAFLLESKRAGANVLDSKNVPRYRSYVEDIMGPEFFDYGFGPYRWTCTSRDIQDLKTTDKIAADVLKEQLKEAHDNIKNQLQSNIK